MIEHLHEFHCDDDTEEEYFVSHTWQLSLQWNQAASLSELTGKGHFKVELQHSPLPLILSTKPPQKVTASECSA